MPREAVLDASALLALLNDEPGADHVLEVLPGARLCTVNLAEVVGQLSGAGMPGDAVRAVVGGLGLHIEPFDEELAWIAGTLLPATRGAGLSLGDRACLAAAARRKLPALTTDRAWASVDVGVEVDVIR